VLELIIYKWFLLSEIFRVAKPNNSLISANGNNKGGISEVRRNVIMEPKC